MPSGAEVTAIHAGHVIGAVTADVIATKAPNAIAAEATHVSSTEAAHVASAEAATTVPSAATPAAAGLRTRGKKAAGKHCACQNHHHSSSHDILHLRWAEFPPQDPVKRWRIFCKVEPTSR
jgi:hypothetical protein